MANLSKSSKKLTKKRVIDILDKYRYVTEKNYVDAKPTPEDLDIILEAMENEAILTSIVKDKPALLHNALVLFAANGYATPLKLLFQKVPKDQINFNQKRGKGDNAEITALTLALNLYKLGNHLGLQIIIANMAFNDLRLIEGTSQLAQLIEIAMFDKDKVAEHLVVQPGFIIALQNAIYLHFNNFILAHQLGSKCHPTLLFTILKHVNLPLNDISDQIFAKLIDCLQMLEKSNYPLPFNNHGRLLFSVRFRAFSNSSNINVQYIKQIFINAIFAAKKHNQTHFLSLILLHANFQKFGFSKLDFSKIKEMQEIDQDLIFSIALYLKTRDVLGDLDKLLIENLKQAGIADPEKFFDTLLIEPLHIAILDNNTAKVKELIASKVSVKSLFCNVLEPLALAAKVPNSDQVVRALLEAGASVDLKVDDRSENCPTIFANAVRNKNIQLLQYLIKRGFNVNSKIGNQSVLHVSIQTGFYVGAIMLLRNKADVNAQDPNQNTALHLLLSSVIFDERTFKSLAQVILVAKPNVELKNSQDQELRQMLSDKNRPSFPLLRQAMNEVHTLNRRFVNIGFILFEKGLNLDVIAGILAFELHFPRAFKITRDLRHDLNKLYTSWLNWKNRVHKRVQPAISIEVEDNNNNNNSKSSELTTSKAEKNLISDEKTLCIFWNRFGNNKSARKQLTFSNNNDVHNHQDPKRKKNVTQNKDMESGSKRMKK
ncbi:MAG: ankyrin repeat domain-containing protein [Gammaproteobacteria bacterium]|jgi:hypothetical protein|nr:ankyrin repeat domain-containing protein [Gammaproteobacteria bacterium]